MGNIWDKQRRNVRFVLSNLSFLCAVVLLFDVNSVVMILIIRSFQWPVFWIYVIKGGIFSLDLVVSILMKSDKMLKIN